MAVARDVGDGAIVAESAEPKRRSARERLATQRALLAGRCVFEILLERLVDVTVRSVKCAVFVDEPTLSIEVVECGLIRVHHGGVGLEKYHPGRELIQARGEIVVRAL